MLNIFVLRTKVSLCSGNANCRRKCSFCDILRIICHNDPKSESVILHNQNKELAKYQYLGIAFLLFYFF